MRDVQKRITPGHLSFREMKISFDCEDIFKDEDNVIECQPDKILIDQPEDCIETVQSNIFSFHLDSSSLTVGNDTKKFLDVNKSELEDRMDVDIWVEKVANMNNVQIKECSYDMNKLLGK